MKDVYEVCPIFENEKYLLRFIHEDDVHDLLKVYSDEKSIPLFNSDNCLFEFRLESLEEMQKCVKFWIDEYYIKYYVRWAIIDKTASEAIGTIELFRRQANDYFTNCGLLRLDLRSDYEKEEELKNILSLIVPPTFEMFNCDKIATKVLPAAVERIKVLNNMNFTLSNEKLYGNDGAEYINYFVLSNEL